MTRKVHDIGVAKRLGPYSDGIETASNQRWLFTAGTPGMDGTGALPPDITQQARLTPRCAPACWAMPGPSPCSWLWRRYPGRIF